MATSDSIGQDGSTPLDPTFRINEEYFIQTVLDGLKKLINYGEHPQGFLSRQVLQSLVETLPTRTSHLINKH